MSKLKSFTRKAVVTLAAGATLAGVGVIAEPIVTPAVNQSTVARSVGVQIPEAAAQAATAPNCNKTGIPIKAGKCFSTRDGWYERGETFSYNGKSYTRYYKKARAFWYGINLGYQRTGDTRAQPTTWAPPRI